jgi:hypothetical protein
MNACNSDNQPLKSLQKLCSLAIWRNVGLHRLQQLDLLPLPGRIRHYVFHSHNLDDQESRAVIIRQTTLSQFRKGDDPSGTRPVIYVNVSMENPSYANVAPLLRQWDRLRHPGIIPCYYQSENIQTKKYHCVLGNFPNITLNEWLVNRPKKSSQPDWIFVIGRLLLQVAEAVQYLHHRGIYNSRLNPGNIIVSAEGKASIVLVNMTDLNYKWFGPPHYPSVEKRSGKADVWRLGLILYQLLLDPLALSEETLSGVDVSIIYRKIDLSVRNQHVPESVARFLKLSLNINPARRPNMREFILFAYNLYNTKDCKVPQHKRPASAPVTMQRTCLSMGACSCIRRQLKSASVLRRPVKKFARQCHKNDKKQEKSTVDCKPQIVCLPPVSEKVIVWPDCASFFRVHALHSFPLLPPLTRQKQIKQSPLVVN